MSVKEGKVDLLVLYVLSSVSPLHTNQWSIFNNLWAKSAQSSFHTSENELVYDFFLKNTEPKSPALFIFHISFLIQCPRHQCMSTADLLLLPEQEAMEPSLAFMSWCPCKMGDIVRVLLESLKSPIRWNWNRWPDWFHQLRVGVRSRIRTPWMQCD